MKISYNWLKTLLDTGHTPAELASLLTGTGLEVEGMESFETLKGGLRGLVIGEVLECSKHPDADRLSLTRVNVGQEEPLSIVCGAPNVAAGQKVIVATVGTTLYPATGEPFTIKKSKIRGALSEGMICAEDEIGIGSSHAGIMVLDADAEPGLPASTYLNLEADTILEIGLTPNRGDAASHLGVARDLAAVLNTQEHSHKHQVKYPGMEALPDANNNEKVTVKIADPKGCRRYSSMIIAGITVKDSPDWLQNRLRSVGLRAVNNIVDVTNFVMLELGQPLHAFDLSAIKDKKIIVRCAHADEKIRTLDGVERKLAKEDLLICDNEVPLCIAGILGGTDSGVTEKTTAVFLESAWFDPDYIRNTARRHGIRSDASFRFERGTDPDITVKALHRAANLILEIAGGEVAMDIHDEHTEKLEPYKVAFSYTNCIDLIGKDIDRHLIKNILLNLGMEIESEGTDGLLLHVPRYRADVTREADVIEEVLRIYGHNNVEPDKHIRYTAAHETFDHAPDFAKSIGELLARLGFTEIMGLSLTSEKYYSDSESLARLVNPLSSDLAVLRPDLIASGLEAISYNINRKNQNLRLFELGTAYRRAEEGKYSESKILSLFVTGELYQQNPYKLNKEADFSFLKSVVQAVLDKCGLNKYSISETNDQSLAYGLSYENGKKQIAKFGAISPATLKNFDIGQQVYYAELNWENVLAAAGKKEVIFTEIPKYPAVRRDLALLLDRSVQYRELEELAYATEKKFLKEVQLFDIYQDPKLGNRKSYALSFTLLNEEATLTEKQIDTVMERLVTAYREKLGAELRS
jgi:phenylalanyl-tRNA synthetase beta chain